MNKDKKIEIQGKIIQNLQSENDYLRKKIYDIENKEILFEKYEQCIKDLQHAKEQYNILLCQLIKAKKQYEKEYEGLIKTVRKNV